MSAVTEKPRVVIVGGGFAGLAAARELDGERYAVTLVDRGADFEYLPNLHELVSRTKKAKSLRLPRRKLVERRGRRFVQAAVVGIDPARQEVRTAGGEALGYDALIVATGSAIAARDVPGAAEHALALRSAAEGAEIGARLRRLADDGGDFSVTLVGGGFTGVEVLGEVLRRYRQRRGLDLRLIEPHGRLLRRQPRVVHQTVRDLARELEVELLLGESVAALEPGRLHLASGSWLRSDLTIWTAGGGPPPLLADSGLAPPGEWVPVRRTLQSRAFEDVFVAGDGAALDEPVSKQSYQATAMGRRAAKNAARLLAGRELKKFEPADERLLITFGYLSGFYVDDDVVLEGGALCLAREWLFQTGMAELDRPRGAGAGRRLRKRLGDALRVSSWPPPVRTVAPYPFTQLPRDRYDAPSPPRVLEWRKADSLGEVADASLSVLGRLGSTAGDQAPTVIDFLSAGHGAFGRGARYFTRRKPRES